MSASPAIIGQRRPASPARRRLAGMALALAACLPTASHAESLLDLYRLAQGSDPMLRAARHALTAAQEKLPQARAGLLPQVSASAANTRSHGFYSFAANPDSEREVASWNWALQLTQPLIRVQNWRALSQAQAQQELAEAQYALAQQDMVLRLVQAYFEVEVARQGIAVTDAQVRATQELLAQNKKGFTAGTHAITDVHEAQSRLELARAQRVGALNDLATKEADLEKLVGPLPAKLEPLKNNAVLPLPTPLDVRSWSEQARAEALQVRVQRAAVAVADPEACRIPVLRDHEIRAAHDRHSSGRPATIHS